MGCASSNTNIADVEGTIDQCDFIYWQPDIKITYKDFNIIPSDTMLQRYSRNFGLDALASFSFRMVLDIPKDEETTLYDKVYLAPAFCRKYSKSLTKDSISIAKQVIYFDIMEVFIRQARKEFYELQDSIKVHNIIGTMFTIEMNDICERYYNFTQVYFNEVYGERIEGAFEKWQKIVANLLNENKEYATTPKDIQRFITNKPIDPRYKMAPTILGELKCN
jgi:hypothetical protein